MVELVKNFILSVTVIDLVDLAIITLIIYKVLQLMRGTRTVQMVLAIIGIIFILAISKLIGLRTTSWLISNFTGYLFIMIVILFQPELRRALVVLGEGRLFGTHKKIANKMLDEIVRASTILANRQIGALIVIERKNDLENIVNLGQKISADVSRDLLISIFIPYSPLHDGAVIISGSRLMYAGCILPLTERKDIPKNYGTRHRAAIGITEVSDAVVVVISEERGSITVVAGGVLSTELDAEALYETLNNLLSVEK